MSPKTTADGTFKALPAPFADVDVLLGADFAVDADNGIREALDADETRPALLTVVGYPATDLASVMVW